MSCWNGLGVNYKSIDPAKIAEDIAYFKAIGLHYIRPHIPAYNASDLQTWRDVAKTFHDAGFYVQWGITTSGGITSSNKAAFLSAITTEAQYAQANHICHELGLGNEEELHCDNSTYLYADVRNDIRTKATEIQSIFTDGPISYQTCCGTVGSGHGSDVWASEGKGDLDIIGVNTYGTWNTTTKRFTPQYKSYITNFYAAFGANCYISEFNLDANNTNFQDIPEERALLETRNMQKYIKDSGITRAQLYQWRGWKDTTDSDFNLKMINGDYKLSWNALANNNGRQWFINV